MAAWAGDARYTELVRTHGTSLLQLAVLLTGNRHDAEDIVQDALISVANSWSITRPTAGGAYLRRAVANRAIDVARSRREIASDEIPDAAHIDTGFLEYENDQRFFELLAALPERQRATLVLKYHAELGNRDIARILGVTVTTVRSQMQHGLAKLRAQQADLAQTELSERTTR